MPRRGTRSVPDCTYGQGFWCKIGRALTCAGAGIAALAHAFKPVGQALLGVVAALAVALIAIVAASWFIFEPMSANASIDETQTSGAITQVLTAKLNEQYKGGRYLRSTHPRANACLKANVTIDPLLPDNLREGFLKGKDNGEKTYQAVVRFSNAADHLSDDGARDFRGMAIKIVGVQGPKISGCPIRATSRARRISCSSDTTPSSSADQSSSSISSRPARRAAAAAIRGRIRTYCGT